MNPPYYLLEDGQPTGPHSLVVLRQKAEIRVIGPDTLVCPLQPADTPWTPIREIPDLHALLFPPKAAPTLGAAHFTATNPVSDSATRPVEVDRLLQDNTARLVASERVRFHSTPVRSRRARRHRTYFFTVLAFALPAWALHHFNLLPRDQVSVALLVGAVGVAALISYWIIYHITDFRS